jgi:tetratricopeptide (TPR) repeat protein
MSRLPTLTNSFIVGYFVVLVMATIAAYSGIFQGDILRWDDNIYLRSELVQSLTMDNLVSILSGKHHSNWHPLTTLSFAIEHALWGTNAFYSKLTNLFLHLINVLLFFILSYHLLLLATENTTKENIPRIFSLLLDDKKKLALYASLFAATLFSLHPQHVESVAWISERKGLICTIFYLSALIAYIKAAGEQSRFFSNLTLIFMLFALMSKPMAVSLPIALILLDIYPLRKIEKLNFSVETLRLLLQGKLTYFLLAIASAVITLLYQDTQTSEMLGYIPRLINATAAYQHYLTTIFYPENLSPFYPFLDLSLKPSINSIVPILFFLILVFIGLTLYIKGIHFPLIIISFYVISLLPVIGIVKVGRQAMADRYAYLPTIWFYLIIGLAIFALLAMLKRTRQQYIVAVLFFTICTSLGFTTFEHTRHWQNDVRLWERVIDIFPDSASVAYINLAVSHDVKGDMGIAQIEQLIKKGLSISPDDPYNLGAAANFYGMLGEEQKALEYVLRIITVAPYNTWAQAQAGDIYFKRNDVANAGNHYLAALKHGSDSEEVVYRLAIIDYRYQRYSDALSKLELLPSTKMGEKEMALYKKIQEALMESAQIKQ